MDLKVAVCQLTSTDDLQSNVRAISNLLSQLEVDSPDLVCFPENALYMRLREGVGYPEISLHDPGFHELSAWALKQKCFLHLGSVPIRHEGRFYSSSLLINSDGVIRSVYQKIHLFDVDVEGHKPVRESDIFAHGSDSAVFSIKGWKFGSSICYDLRFAELFSRYALAEVDVILVPSAFLVPTGRDHWEVLLRARAIESQAYVLAAAQGGVHRGLQGGERFTYGHSMIVDPWGRVLAEAAETAPTEKAGILRCTLSREQIQRVRAQIPMRAHRRLDRP